MSEIPSIIRIPDSDVIEFNKTNIEHWFETLCKMNARVILIAGVTKENQTVLLTLDSIPPEDIKQILADMHRKAGNNENWHRT